MPKSKYCFFIFFSSDESAEISKTSENGCSDEEVPNKCFRADLTQLNVNASSVISKMTKTDTARSKVTNNNNNNDLNGANVDGYHNGNSAVHSDESDDETCTEKGELETSNGKTGEKNYDLDVVFVQDVGFTVKIQSPGVEIFEIQVCKS